MILLWNVIPSLTSDPSLRDTNVLSFIASGANVSVTQTASAAFVASTLPFEKSLHNTESPRTGQKGKQPANACDVRTMLTAVLQEGRNELTELYLTSLDVSR